MARSSKTNTETKAPETLQIKALQRGVIRLRLIGTEPLFMNRMSAKAKQVLLVGSKKKTTAEKANIKHDPMREFVDAMDRNMATGPTALLQRIDAIKSSMCEAAIETEGLTKTGTQRLLFLPGEKTPFYGVPQLRMDITRNADPGRTPDVRTRPFFPQWGCEVEVQYIMPQLNQHAVVTLLSNAGVLIGLGDFRQGKGKGCYGQFRVIGADQQDDEWDFLVKNCGRSAQEAAIKNPEFANFETEELFEFCLGETKRRAA